MDSSEARFEDGHVSREALDTMAEKGHSIYELGILLIYNFVLLQLSNLNFAHYLLSILSFAHLQLSNCSFAY